jgi:predicted nucleotidyltransferase
MTVFPHHKSSLGRISSRLAATLTDNFVGMYAFGSRVRGDHDQNSDFDVLVIVRNKNPKVESIIVDIFLEEEAENGISFDPVIKSLACFELEKEHNTPFYENVVRDGVMV